MPAPMSKVLYSSRRIYIIDDESMKEEHEVLRIEITVIDEDNSRSIAFGTYNEGMDSTNFLECLIDQLVDEYKVNITDVHWLAYIGGMNKPITEPMKQYLRSITTP